MKIASGPKSDCMMGEKQWQDIFDR